MWLLLFFIFSLLLAPPVQAAGEFATNYRVNYRVGTDGQTRSRMEVELTNKLSNIYASEFTLSIGSTNLSEISLSTPDGPIEPQVARGNKTTNITVIFPKKVLGKDKSQQFTLEFTTTDFARHLGNIWEVSIPKLAKSEDLNSYNLTLSIPTAFGQAAMLTPAPTSQQTNDGLTVYRFSSDSLYQSGISATFGTEQWYDFRLRYHLTNANFYPVETEIALPPDTAWQQVLYQTIDPTPTNIRLDADGNWLARFRLGASSNLQVTATGSAALYLQPRSDYPWGINPNVNYLQPLKYWEADQSKIKALADKLSTPRQIYDYAVDHLIYDYGRLGSAPTRLGAANALDKQDSALCLEFTDLFIALARAAGIPARAVNGFAYTDNANLRPLSLEQDVLHAWPEYYDDQRQLWRPIDPTWGNTTGGVDFFNQTDLNHFAFVTLGQDSAYPIPAGAYKTDDQPAKNVAVNFGHSVLPRPQLQLELKLPREGLAGVSLTGKILVKNSGNVALYQTPIKLATETLQPLIDSWTIDFLAPQSQTEIEFSLPASSWRSNFTETLTASTALTQTTESITLTPAYRLVLANRAVRFGALSLTLLVVLKLIYAGYLKANSH